MIVQKVKVWILSVDKTLIVLLMLLTIIGCLLVFSSSPVVAGKLNLPSLFFVKRHLFNVVLGFLLLIFISFLPENLVRKSSLIFFCIFLFLVLMANLAGTEIKGSTRWIRIFGFNMQPSEFLKPFYIVVVARILSLGTSGDIKASAQKLRILIKKKKKLHFNTSFRSSKKGFPSYRLVTMLHIVVVLLLLKQPDFGMAATYTVIFISLIFLSGISFYWLFLAAGLMVYGVFISYKYLPHVSYRINSFLQSDGGANYQVEKSIDSYVSGGIFGQGPLGGNIKYHLPDCHTDFIFSVAAEEFGAIFASLIVVLIMMIAVRSLVHCLRAEDNFKFFAISGIAILYSFQSIFNIGVTLNLLPTKGMTLPFLSYGGSSTLSFMIAFGILLNFTKKNFGRLNIRNNLSKECLGHIDTVGD